MAQNTADLLTAPQRRAITALMESRTNQEAAEKAKIAPRTLYRWLRDPIFKQALQEAESETTDLANRRLAFGTKMALDTLLFIMYGKHTPDSLRLAAARAWLDSYHRSRDYSDLDARITALEAQGDK